MDDKPSNSNTVTEQDFGLEKSDIPQNARSSGFWAFVDRHFGSVLVGTFSILSAYTYFLGNSFLSQRLRSGGFEGASLNLSVQDAFFQALLGINQLVAALMEGATYYTLSKPLLWVLPTLFFTSLFFILHDKNSKSRKSILKKAGPLHAIRNRLMKNSGVQAIAITLFGSIGYYLITMALIAIILLFWLTVAVGAILGESAAKKDISSPVCVCGTDNNRKNVLWKCTELTLENGAVLFGKIIHSTDEKTYFLTNDTAYTLRANNTVMYAKKYKVPDNRPASCPASDD